MDANRVPAEAFPVGVFIAEEMAARGWSAADVAARMAEGVEARAVWELTVRLLVECSDTPFLTIKNETADALGRAFGVSPQFFINMNDSYHAWRAAQPCHQQECSK